MSTSDELITIELSGLIFWRFMFNCPPSLLTVCTDTEFLFKKSKQKSFKLQLLLSSASSAAQHSFWIYHQVQVWLEGHLSLSWGRKTSMHGLLPVTTEDPPAPPNILKRVFCTCVKCRASCRCRKVSILCSHLWMLKFSESNPKKKSVLIHKISQVQKTTTKISVWFTDFHHLVYSAKISD